MAELSRRANPWWAEFDRDSRGALDSLLRGEAEVPPFDRADSSDILVQLFGGLQQDDPSRLSLDRALCAWLEERRNQKPAIRQEYGVRRYVDELIQALVTVQQLSLRATADHLREHFGDFYRWLGGLVINLHEDPRAELLRVMALQQVDRRFLPEWYHLCDEAGRSLPDHYLSLGLLGLRRLPAQDDAASLTELNTEVVAGLFRWASHLSPTKTSRKAFQQQFRTLQALYPRAPKQWRDLLAPFAERYSNTPIVQWVKGAGVRLKEGTGRAEGVAQALPPRHVWEDLVRRAERDPIEIVTAEIKNLITVYEKHAQARGDTYQLVRAACNFAYRLKDRSPQTAVELAQLARLWEPFNAYTWTTLASSLAALGDHQGAEATYWEAIRRFPENPVSRNSLAELLAGSACYREAEHLFRETLQRFPQDRVARTAFAKFLVGVGQNAEAEALLRATMAKFSDDPYSRNTLANLLSSSRRVSEAETLFRQTMAHFPDDCVSFNGLAKLLARNGRSAEAELLLRQTIERFPQDTVALNALANLLARLGRNDQAEALYRQATADFPQDHVAPTALAFWMLRWDRLEEAESLLEEAKLRYGQPKYLDHLKGLLADRRAGQDIATELESWAEEGWEPEELAAANGEASQEHHKATLPAAEVARAREWASSAELSAADAANPGSLASEASFSGSAARPDSPEALRSSSPPTAPLPSARVQPRPVQSEPLVLRNARISRADFYLRAFPSNGHHQPALRDLRAALADDPNHVYPRLVLGLHDREVRREIRSQARAFPHAYPLQFLALQAAFQDEEGWARLEQSFPQHRPLTWLGHLEAGANGHTVGLTKRLQSWAVGSDPREQFSDFLVARARGWLFPTGELPSEEMIRGRVAAHREQIVTLLNDGLRRAADEGSG